MKLGNILGGASAMLSLIAAQPAWAQSSDSGSIDVDANLELVQAQVDILGVAPVQFGTLGIPNGTLPGSECRYIMTAVDNFNVQNLASQVEVRDVQSNGTMSISDGITPSGCTTSGNKTRGIFTIRCTPGVNMFLIGEIQSGPDNAIELRNAMGLAFNVGGSNPLF